jgi:hypothetical protein
VGIDSLIFRSFVESAAKKARGCLVARPIYVQVMGQRSASGILLPETSEAVVMVGGPGPHIALVSGRITHGPNVQVQLDDHRSLPLVGVEKDSIRQLASRREMIRALVSLHLSAFYDLPPLGVEEFQALSLHQVDICGQIPFELKDISESPAFLFDPDILPIDTLFAKICL